MQGTHGSVTEWLGGVRAGDPEAVRQLWRRYCGGLVGVARRRIRGGRCAVADEEDVALDAFEAFCREARRGGFPGLCDRDGLWRVLATIAGRRALNLVRAEARRPTLAAPADAADPAPGPDLAAQVAEEVDRLLGLLGDDALVAVARLKMDGHSTEEVAERLGCVPRTVERKLALIRRLWQAGAGDVPA